MIDCSSPPVLWPDTWLVEMLQQEIVCLIQTRSTNLDLYDPI